MSSRRRDWGEVRMRADGRAMRLCRGRSVFPEEMEVGEEGEGVDECDEADLAEGVAEGVGEEGEGGVDPDEGFEEEGGELARRAGAAASCRGEDVVEGGGEGGVGGLIGTGG